MRPRIALERPLIARMFLAYFLRDFTEHRVIVRSFVLRDGAPIQSFCRHGQVAETIYHFRIQLLSIGELLVHERHTRDAHLQTRAEPIFRQITFNAGAFDAFGIQNENRRRPDRVESFEVRGVFFDVSFEWDEVLVDEVSGFLIGIGLGFQPSTCASSRRGGEID